MIKILSNNRRMRHEEVIRRLDKIENLLKCLNDGNFLKCAAKPVIPDRNGYLLTHEVCNILRISKRTLSRYRANKMISYYMLDGKAYYKMSEIEDFMTRKGHGAMVAVNQGEGVIREVGQEDAALLRRKLRKGEYPAYYPTRQVCALLGINSKQLTRLRKEGVIRYTPVSRTSGRYNVADVHALMERHKSESPK